MSLLDDVSVVVTPNGYKAGTLYSVLPTAIAGSELVQDSNFTLTGTQAQNTAGTYWVTYAGWTISGGKALRSGVSTNTPIAQNVPVVNGKVYKFSYTRTYASGNGETNLFVQTDGSNYVTLGSYTSTVVEEHTVTGTFVAGFTGNIFWQLYGIGTFAGSVDNISVKEWSGADMEVTRATAATRVDENGLVNYAEVISETEEVINGDFATDSDWSKGGGATISGGQANIDGDGTSFTSITQSNVFTEGKRYKVTTDVIITSGLGLKFQDGANNENIGFATTTGSYEFYFTATSNTSFVIGRRTGGTAFDSSVDNISVKEADRDNVPRIDYTGGGCPHILAEPQRTNLVTYSEDFSQSIYLKSNVTLTSGFISPFGTPTAKKLIEGTNNGSHFIYSNVFLSGLRFFSVYLKKAERDYAWITDSQNGNGININLTNGTFTSINNPTNPKIENVGNDWYRCSFGSNVSSVWQLRIDTAIDSGRDYQGDGTSGIYIFGAQLEEGSYPTSYIPTSGSTVTRNQDVFTRDGIASLINSTEGVLFAEIASLIGDEAVGQLSISNGTSSEAVKILWLSANSIRLEMNTASGTDFFKDITVTRNGGFDKLAIQYKSNNYKIYFNGSAQTVTQTAAIPSGLNKLSLDRGDGGSIFFGKVRQLQVYKTALTDAQLTSLTT